MKSGAATPPMVTWTPPSEVGNAFDDKALFIDAAAKFVPVSVMMLPGETAVLLVPPTPLAIASTVGAV